MLFQAYLGKKYPKFFAAGSFFRMLQIKYVYRSALIFRTHLYPEKFMVTRLFNEELIAKSGNAANLNKNDDTYITHITQIITHIFHYINYLLDDI